MISQVLHLCAAKIQKVSEFKNKPLSVVIAHNHEIFKDSESPRLHLSLIHLNEDAQSRSIGIGTGSSRQNSGLRVNLYVMMQVSGADHIQSWEILEIVMRFLNENPSLETDDGQLTLEYLSVSLQERMFMWTSNAGLQYPALFYRLKGMEIRNI